MLTYDEFKQAINDGYIVGDTVMIVRKNGRIFDYVLSGEPVRPWEVVTDEKVEAVLMELDKEKKTSSRSRGIVGERCVDILI